MKRLILPILAGIVLGGIVHLVAVLILPYLSEQDAYARLSAVGDPNRVAQIDDPSALGAVLPATDPAFISAVCLYDLSDGPLKVRVPTTEDYTSVSFYTRFGLPFYAINDRSAGRSIIELDLMNSKQRAALPEDEEVTAADRLIVESPSNEGIVLIRAMVRERGAREEVRARMEAANCGPAL
ncbi:DUF1254 domain-containing protein [Ancylobacter sp. TS-1]|uniref:DUF1254 domain-containing protein n=1 Tax=Ancylobacter sp. TS-1 TaxID=1850374 RepID=UPI001265C9F3|nr:DUF1254 domain-containing protein [Ancylobacter sp. TS-1]QFR31694.1 DUF1254 domain-containing protein [Ancylobacter sp. TS-1]